MSFMRRNRENALTVFEDLNFPLDVENLTVQIPMPMPSMLRFSANSLLVVIAYCVCFLIAAIGNLTVFITLSRGRYRKSRISLMICHLSLADLVVTFFMIPIEVGWRITIKWIAGNMACKIFSFLRIFGLYLSSNILICVSLDRYFAVLHPLKVNAARRRGKTMLLVAWVCSAIFAAPQSFIFHVSTHRSDPSFQQCDTIGSFASKFEETAYTFFCVLVMYFVPLLIITWVYVRIFCEINNKTRDAISRSNSNGPSDGGCRLRLRRSDMRNIERARSRTLWMTIIIVAVFILCWTPYVFMVLWYMIDKKSAELVDQRVQDCVYIMAVANSCVNPIVYGSYAVDLRKECCSCFSSQNSTNNVLRESRLMRQNQHGNQRKLPTNSADVDNCIRCSLRRVFRIFVKDNAELVSSPLCGNRSTTLLNGTIQAEVTPGIPERLPLHEIVSKQSLILHNGNIIEQFPCLSLNTTKNH